MKKLIGSLLVVAVLMLGSAVALACVGPDCPESWSPPLFDVELTGGYEQDCNGIDCAEIRVAARVDQWAYVKLDNTDVYWKIYKPGNHTAKILSGCYVTNGQFQMVLSGFDGLWLDGIDAMRCMYGWSPNALEYGIDFNGTGPVLPKGEGFFEIWMQVQVKADQTPGLYLELDPPNLICFSYLEGCQDMDDNPWIDNIA